MKPKGLPRLWCALQGLLPLEACLAAQRAELAWPLHEPAEDTDVTMESRIAGEQIESGPCAPLHGTERSPREPLGNQNRDRGHRG